MIDWLSGVTVLFVAVIYVVSNQTKVNKKLLVRFVTQVLEIVIQAVDRMLGRQREGTDGRDCTFGTIHIGHGILKNPIAGTGIAFSTLFELFRSFVNAQRLVGSVTIVLRGEKKTVR